MEFTGQFYDGVTSKPWQVAISISSVGISIVKKETGEVLQWNFDKVHRLEKQKDKVLVHYGDKFPYLQLTIDSVACMEGFTRFAGNYPFMKSPHLRFEKLGAKAYAGAVAAIVGFVLLVHFVVIPGIQFLVVSNLSVDYEKSLSAQYLVLLKETEQIDSLKSAQLSQFINELKIDTEYEIEAYVVESEMVNAMALPGGYMVVYTGILDKMDRSEELVALVGHELGHVEKKHGLNQVVKQLSKSFLLRMLLGDSNALLEGVGGVVSMFDQMSYSRDAEREADEFGYKVLVDNNLDPNGMIDLFKVLQAEGGDEKEYSKIMNSMSTHPLTSERIEDTKKRMETTSIDVETNPVLDDLFFKMKE